MALLCNIIFILIVCYPCVLHAHVFNSFVKLPLPSSQGSEACAFDSNGEGPYTTLNDGRIVKYQGPDIGFTDFATASSNRSKELCDGIVVDCEEIGVTCGRSIGLEFNQKTGELYTVDSFYGLMSVGKQGGIATQLSGNSDGVPVDVLDAVDVDPITGTIYYTDLGPIYLATTNMSIIMVSGDTGGRLIKYDPKTKQRTVVLTGLSGPNGVAVSKNGDFVLISECIGKRVQKFWVKGPKANNTSEVLINLVGHPDNIKRNKDGDFWVPVNVLKDLANQTYHPLAQKFNARGQILETLDLSEQYHETYITEVNEHLGSLYVASVYTDFVGVFSEVTSNFRFQWKLFNPRTYK